MRYPLFKDDADAAAHHYRRATADEIRSIMHYADAATVDALIAEGCWISTLQNCAYPEDLSPLSQRK